MDESLLNSLSNKEKEIFKKGLKDLINRTYVLEDEYKKLNVSYIALQEFISQIIEVEPNALWVLDDNGDIFLQNSEAKKIPKVLEYIDYNSKNTDEVEYDGSFYLIKIVSQKEKTIISATDITEEKRKDRLASMGQVAAHISHEIRNPIGSVSLLSSVLFKKIDIKNKPLVLEIQKSIWRVERIIKATLLFTKGIQPNFQYFYLNKLTNECKLAVKQYTFSKEINCNFNFPHTQVKCDFELIVLVLQNFIFNAIDAIEESDDEKGVIDIIYKNGSIYVTDSGEEIKNKNILFESFKTTKTKGHGLGLALSLQIIKAHHGKIELLENIKGFKITLEDKK
ncbi:MAG: two-component sensor histidine kinase [Sulfurospirillum sp.]|nr:two-component sensor histidine kinase [Sulfurospirillum sp.]MBL0702757.1 two-component sensor histidine kinase [Sulfurospirillum sp.]